MSKRPDVPEFLEYKAYFADAGQQEYDKRRRNCGCRNKVIKCGEMVKFVEKKMLSEEKWSPDAAIGCAVTQGLFKETFTTKTFYNWIDDCLVGVRNIDLLLKTRRRPKHPRKERKKNLGRSIGEFASSAKMERGNRTKVYYAHPYSSCERGTNENWSGIVRRFVPKGSSFEGLTDDGIKRIAYYINTLPRKRFGYKTPLQMWETEIALLAAA